MTINQNADAELFMGMRNQPPERRMVGLIDCINSGQSFLDAKAVPINLHIYCDYPWNGTKTTCNSHRANIGKRRQRSIEHLRIEFIRLAVDVEIGSREVCDQHRRT